MRPLRLALQLLLQRSARSTQYACLRCGFGNRSHWRTQTQDFIENKVQHVDVVSLLEHHIPSQLMNRIKVVTSVHRRCLFTVAASFGRSEDGTSRGVVALPFVHLRLLPLQHSLFYRKPDWVHFQIRLRGLDLNDVQGYIFTALGPNGEHIRRLSSFAKHSLAFNMPFITVADWKMNPQELQSTFP